MFVKIFREGEDGPRNERFPNIREGDIFYINGVAHTAAEDAHYSGDSSYQGFLVYDANGESFFPEDLDFM